MKIESAVLAFAKSMQRKLDANRYKACDNMNLDGKGRTWTNCELFWLLRRLRQETIELEEALFDADREAVIDEAADVGNFAMMIHDIVIKAGATDRKSSV